MSAFDEWAKTMNFAPHGRKDAEYGWNACADAAAKVTRKTCGCSCCTIVAAKIERLKE